jgi:hypothetical protein
MRYSDLKIFRFDFVSLYCLIYKIAHNLSLGFAARLVREPLTSKNFQFSQGKIALLWDFLYIFAAELAI